MLALSLLSWWYSKGWMTLFKRILRMIRSVIENFSVVILLRTMFAPWKQIVAPDQPNQNIQMRLRGVLDTLVSRVVGFMMRSATLLAALVVTILLGAVGAASLLIWPLIPLSVPFFILKSAGL